MDRRGFAAALKVGPLPWLLGLAAAGFAASATLPHSISLPGICGSLGLIALAGTAGLVAQTWSPAALLTAWLVMLAAMMPPLLAQPVGHVWHSSLRARRPRALAMFGLGYAAVWIGAGALLIPAAVGLRLVAPGLGAPLAALVLALGWSGSPAGQAARNRCHRVYRIAAFGMAADRACLRHGLMTGAACAGACWPWMLLPLSCGDMHLAAMTGVTAMLLAERAAPPARPAWRLPPPLAMFVELRGARRAG